MVLSFLSKFQEHFSAYKEFQNSNIFFFFRSGGNNNNIKQNDNFNTMKKTGC